MRFQDKVALITGSGAIGGIGYATAELLRRRSSPGSRAGSTCRAPRSVS
jgi:NAD(P)-dependent dehydrogenase (short-subunit alcohol dehydrogenase family)